MDVYSFITTFFLFLVETRAASFENVEIKLGRNRFIIPLKVPIFVTRINAVNLADFKLPVPDLLEFILQARAVPSTSPPPSRQSLPPDRLVPTEEYTEPHYPEPGLSEHRPSTPYQPLPPKTKPDSPHSQPYDNNDESKTDSEDNEDSNESNDFNNNLQAPKLDSSEHLLPINDTYNQQWPTTQSEHDSTVFQDLSEEPQIYSDEQDESFESYNYQNSANPISTITSEKISSEISPAPLFTEEDPSSYLATEQTTRYDTQYSTLTFVEDSSDSEEGEINYDFNPTLQEDRTTSNCRHALAEDIVNSEHTPSSIQDASFTTQTLLDDIATTDSTIELAEDIVISHVTPEFPKDVPTPDCATEFPKYATTTHPTTMIEDDYVTSEPTIEVAVILHPEMTNESEEDEINLDEKYSFAKDTEISHSTSSMEDDIITSTHPLILDNETVNSSPKQSLQGTTDTDYITIAPEQDIPEQSSDMTQTSLPTIKLTTDGPGQLLPTNTPAKSCDQPVPYTTTDNLMTSYSDEDTSYIAAEMSTSTQYNEKDESLSTTATDYKNKHESELSLAKSSTDMTTNECIETSSLQYTPDVSSSLASTDLHVQDTSIETSSSLTTVEDGSETWSPGIDRRSTTTKSYTLNDLSKYDTSTETPVFTMLNTATNGPEISSSVQCQTTFSSASYALTDLSMQDRLTVSDGLVSASDAIDTLIETPGTSQLIQNESTVSPTSDTTTSFPIQEISTISEILVFSSVAPVTVVETPGTSPLIQSESMVSPTPDSITSFPIQEISTISDGLVSSFVALDTLMETPGTSPLIQSESTVSPTSDATTSFPIQEISTISDGLVSSFVALDTLMETPGTSPLIQSESTVSPTSDATTSFPIQEISTISDGLVSSFVALDTLMETPGTSPLIQSESTVSPTRDSITSFPIQEISTISDGIVSSSIALDKLIEKPETSPLIQNESTVSPTSDTTTSFPTQEISSENEVFSSSIRNTSNSPDTLSTAQYKTTTSFAPSSSTDLPQIVTEASMPLSSNQDVAINTSEISSRIQYISTVSSASVELPVPDISPETPVPQSLVSDYTTNAPITLLSVKSTHETTSATNTTLVPPPSVTTIVTTASLLPARNTTVSTSMSSRPQPHTTSIKKKGAVNRIRRRKKRPCHKDKPKIIRRRRRRRRRSTTPLPRVTTRRSTTQHPKSSSPNITDSTALGPNDWNTNDTNSATPGHKSKPKIIRRRRRRRRSTTPLPRLTTIGSTTQHPKTMNSNITDSTTLGPKVSGTNVKNSAIPGTSSTPNTTLPRNT